MNRRTLQSLILGVSIGAAVGLGAYTFIYAKGGSYLTNNPASCANCYYARAI
jgi:cytochrome c nitrite reductase small subunit